eukprot:Skav206497  [mRNA]  locus=scaffold1128:189962:194201:+ [translate_table: standard]
MRLGTHTDYRVCRTAVEVQQALAGPEDRHDIAFDNLNDLEQCISALAELENAKCRIRSLKLDSLVLEAPHFELLGRALESLDCCPQRSVALPDSDEGPEMNLFDFDEAPEALEVMEADRTIPGANPILPEDENSYLPNSSKSLYLPSSISSSPSLQLETLAILRCPGPSSDAWSPLWQGLPRTLTQLDISENGLNDHAVAALCGALRLGGLRLVSLNLRGNRCKDVQRLADLLSRGQVEMLDLAENTLNDRGGEGSSLRVLPAARIARGFLWSGQRFVFRCYSLLHHCRTTIRHLALRRSSLCDKGVSWTKGVVQLASWNFFVAWFHFEALESYGILSSFFVLVSGSAAVLAATLQRCTLQSLDIAGHNFSLEVVQDSFGESMNEPGSRRRSTADPLASLRAIGHFRKKCGELAKIGREWAADISQRLADYLAMPDRKEASWDLGSRERSATRLVSKVIHQQQGAESNESFSPWEIMGEVACVSMKSRP